jgi:MFS transporter, DHA1 family, tetracycline resistance protein
MMSADDPDPRGPPGEARDAAGRRPAHLLEPWFAPFALVNGSAVGLVPILLPLVALRYGVGHVGLVMGAFQLGAFAAPLAGLLADRLGTYRSLTAGCAAISALALWLFPLAGPGWQLLLALANGAGFAGAVTVANLLIVERRPRSEWNQRLGWLETALSVGQGAALLLAAWLSGLHARPALLIAALVPAAGIPLALLLIPRMRPPRTAAGSGAATGVTAGQRAARRSERASHVLVSAGRVGEWGPASPTRVHHASLLRKPPAGLRGLLGGGFGWLLAAWIPAYAGSAVLFALYPVLFLRAFGVSPHISALAFAAIVFASLPLFVVAGRVSQRRGPAQTLAGAFATRLVLLGALAAMAAVGGLPAVLPLTAFAGIMFGWSFLSVASPGIAGQLKPDNEGDAQGMLNASSGLAGLAGAVIAGFAASRWGYPAALAIGAGATAIGLIIFVFTVLRGHGRATYSAPTTLKS